MMLLSTIGKVSMSVLAWAPVISWVFIASWMVLTGEVCHETQTLTSLLMLPSQLNLVGSYLAPLIPSSGSVGTER
jgi:hypothetical protein